MTNRAYGLSPVSTLTDEQIRQELDTHRTAEEERVEALTEEASRRYFYTKNLLGPYIVDPPERDEYADDPDPIVTVNYTPVPADERRYRTSRMPTVAPHPRPLPIGGRAAAYPVTLEVICWAMVWAWDSRVAWETGPYCLPVLLWSMPLSTTCTITLW